MASGTDGGLVRDVRDRLAAAGDPEKCEANLDDTDFFLRKAVGWALPQHARTDPVRVRAFVDRHGDRISALSRREALKKVSAA